jgi:hypothetical protein
MTHANGMMTCSKLVIVFSGNHSRTIGLCARWSCLGYGGRPEYIARKTIIFVDNSD